MIGLVIMKTAIHILCAGIFWIWNTAFLLLIYFGLLPVVGIGLVSAIFSGAIPWPFTLSLLGLMLVPPLCTALGWRLRKHPVLLMRLFYGMEAPLLALCLLRLFVLRETTPASSFVLGAAAIAIATFTLELFFGYAAYHRSLAWFQMATHALVLMVGLYLGGLLLFYTVPVLCLALYGFLQFGWLRWLWESLAYTPPHAWLTMTLVMFVFGFGTTLFLAMPYALVNMFCRSWGRIFQGFGRQYGWWQGALVTGGVAIATVALLFATQTQPQAKAFSLLDPSPSTPVAQQAAIAQSDTIRAGLVNAYLHRYRYLSPWQDSNALANWYQSLFAMGDDQAQFWQDLHNQFFAPFLYRGDRDDPERAERLYGEFFDQPIQKAEAEAIQQALESTVNREETKAGLLNIDQNIVRLARQEVSVVPHGDWADITLYERYENPTRDDQEIFYSFSLPESAAITGLWLGEDGMAQRYPFVVSPRGAAQKVYNAEVERGQLQPAVDPALLEQVGPRQYRLRVFPIPARTSAGPGRTHLWLTYQVMQQQGQWPLPQLTEKRSIFWDQKTEHERLGRPVKLDDNTWFEPGIEAKTGQPHSHTVMLPEGYRVTATPLARTGTKPQRLAVVVDTSRSMTEVSLEIAAKELQTAVPQVDWYLSAASGHPQKASVLNLQEISFYGSLQLADLINQFAALQQTETYDAIVVLTDQGSYELADDSADLSPINAPLWILHIGGLAAAYPDAVLELLQTSGGGVTTEVSDLLPRLDKTNGGSAIDGYRWQVAPVIAEASDGNDRPAAIAARYLIRHLSREQALIQVEELDAVHGIAKRAAVVTPYSSMLVLVDERQREALREAELASDRFDRQVEDGKDQLTQPNNPFSNPASAPEPGMAIGLAIVGTVLWTARRRSLNQR
ncbi:PEP-CTERM sorting domain-containing protein [filamentous cyanobacterium CCP5]|nr:PEP-CTERM sorting domain-containing protein [filamentous cyanobacterium CCP5]